MSSMSPSLTLKTFNPLWSHPSPFFWFLPLPLALHWFPLPHPAPPNCWALLIAVLYGFCTATCSCVICSLKLAISSFPSDWADPTWTPSWGQSSCSDSALWTAVMCWGYVILISSYKKHMEFLHCLWSKWKRCSLKCFWTLPMLSIIRYSCCTTFSAPSNWVTFSIIFSVFLCCNL